MVILTASIALAQIGIGMLGAQSAKRQGKRAIRAEQRLNNRAIIRAVGDSQANFEDLAEQQRVAFGAAGVRGGGTAQASLGADQARQLLLEQQKALRGIDTSRAQNSLERDQFFPFIDAVNRSAGIDAEAAAHQGQTNPTNPLGPLPAGLIEGTFLADRFRARQGLSPGEALLAARENAGIRRGRGNFADRRGL